MTKKNIMPVVVLVVICVIVAALLAALNLLTSPIIQKREEQKVYDSLRVVLDGEFKKLDIPEGAPETVSAYYEVTDGTEKKGNVVTLVTRGYNGDISITVGIGTDGKITKAVVTNESESHGKSGMDNYTDRFSGVGSAEVGAVETFTGATISSTAIKTAIIDAVNMVTGSSAEAPAPDTDDEEPTPEVLPRTDAEIEALAKEMGDVETVESIYLYNPPATLKRAYSAGDKGYFAYIVVPGAYVPVATEAMVWLDINCEIVEANLLQWVVGHDVGAGNFADGFTGADRTTVSDVELVSGATGTSVDFRSALADAVYFIEKTVERTDANILKYAKKLVSVNSALVEIDLPDGAKETFKKLYKVESGDGYVAYLVTSTQYVARETETLIYIDANGKLAAIDLMNWTVGHGVEPGSFAENLVGKSVDEIRAVELITGATTTSNNLATAVADAMSVIPATSRAPMIVGIAVLAVAAIAAVAIPVTKSVISSKKRRATK